MCVCMHNYITVYVLLTVLLYTASTPPTPPPRLANSEIKNEETNKKTLGRCILRDRQFTKQ
jgi:hypothetical protein